MVIGQKVFFKKLIKIKPGIDILLIRTKYLIEKENKKGKKNEEDEKEGGR